MPRTVASTEGVRLTGEPLLAAVRTAYPGDTVVEVREPRRPERPVFVVLERDGAPMERCSIPMPFGTSASTFPPILRTVEWLVDLHDNLLAGETGRLLNGIGGIVLRRADRDRRVALVARGTQRLRGLKVGWPQASRRFIWQLHSVLGILSFALLFVWAITAIYFAFPEPFEGTIDYFDDDLNDLDRPGEWVVIELVKLHFGRFGGLGVRFLWLVLGLVPTVLFATGFMLWWTRVVRRRSLPRELTRLRRCVKKAGGKT